MINRMPLLVTFVRRLVDVPALVLGRPGPFAVALVRLAGYDIHPEHDGNVPPDVRHLGIALLPVSFA